MWSLTDFQGLTKVVGDCSALGGDGWKYILGEGLYFNSGKNRCNARKFYMGNGLVTTACLDAGENRPNVADSDRFRVGISGSHCP